MPFDMIPTNKSTLVATLLQQREMESYSGNS